MASCAVTAGLASVNQELYQPALRVLLVWWITLPFIFAGIVAWRRRPDSFFGPLMILAGFVTQLSILQWTSQPLLNTVGQLCDLLVAAVWLHVFLAYPSGRLAGRAERVVVIIGYVAAVGLQVVILMLGGFNDRHMLTVVQRQTAAETVQNVQLLTLSALALIGVVLLWRRWWALPRWQRRRPAQIVINCFSLSLVMLAALLIAGAFQLPGFEIIRLATFAVAGLAPLAFLAGLLDARLAKAGVGELLVQLRASPAPDLQELLARALRDPTLSLIYWLPQYGSWADQNGNPTTLPEPEADAGLPSLSRTESRLRHWCTTPRWARSLILSRRSAQPQGSPWKTAGSKRSSGRGYRNCTARVLGLSKPNRMSAAAWNETCMTVHNSVWWLWPSNSACLPSRRAATPATQTRLKRARSEVAESLSELRDIAHGLHPAVVSGHGLAVALESLAAATPLDVRSED